MQSTVRRRVGQLVLQWPGAGRDDVGAFVLDLSLWLSTTHSHASLETPYLTEVRRGVFPRQFQIQNTWRWRLTDTRSCVFLSRSAVFPVCVSWNIDTDSSSSTPDFGRSPTIRLFKLVKPICHHLQQKKNNCLGVTLSTTEVSVPREGCSPHRVQAFPLALFWGNWTFHLGGFLPEFIPS